MEKIKEFKKVFLQKIIPCVISCVLAVGLACGSYAWYSSSVKFEFNKNFSGTTDVAYFAGGDGSIGNPYIINNRYHVYNLAWLQYLGYFNLGSQVNNGRAQNYFKITANINMEGLAIPPIGTEKYKFIGNIEGGGYAVSNLVVSNDINSLTVRPSTINSVDDCSIVGFFGVLGASASELTKMQTDGKTAIIDGNAVNVVVENTADAPTATAGQAANLIYKKAISAQDFYLDKINVVSTTPKTLIGIAAGYVAGNLQNVGVYRSAVSVEGTATGLATALTDGGSAYGTTVSRYSIVGDYDEKNVTWESLPSGAGGHGDENAMGGSIDFRKLARRINYISTAYYLGKDKPVPDPISSSGIYSFSEAAFNSNLSITFQKKVDFGQFNWKDGNFTDIVYCNLRTGTYLPINVDDKAMGLDAAGNNNTINGESWYINEEYYKASSYYRQNNPDYTGRTGETPRANNTGYIMGGADDNTFLRLRIQKLATASSVSTISKSFGADDGVGLEYSEKKLQLLTKTAVANNKFAVIFDDYNNADGQATAHTQFGSVLSTINVNGKQEKTTYKNLGLIRYAEDGVRDDFANFLGGANKYVYGLRFQKNPEFLGKTIDGNNTKLFLNIDGKPYLKSSIDFNFEQDGFITMVVGTYMSTKRESAFCGLYKEVDGTIRQVTKIQQNTATKKYYSTYYNGSTTTSDNKPAGNYITVFDREWFASLPGGAAYYVEIPVSAGRYFICNDYKTTLSNYAYLMYLDIGANGGGGDGTTPVHYIKTVNFVNEAPSGTVPLTFADYDVVVFFLDEPKGGAVKVVIYFKRKTENIDDGETKKTTKVYYYPVPGLDAMGKITPTPLTYGENNQEAQNWN